MATTFNGVPAPTRLAGSSRFYFRMAVAMAATAFIGFVPTFWMPLLHGVPERITLIAIHAAVFYGWSLFLIWQTWLAMSGRVASHREAGMIGVSLATAMTIFGVLTAINAAQRASNANYAPGGEAFMIVPLSGILLFAVVVVGALVNVRRPEWHKRLMLAATAVVLEAAIARLFITFVVMGGTLPPFHDTVGVAGLPGPPPPVGAVLTPALLGLLFIVAGMIHDWRQSGKVHPAYWWAGGITLAVLLLRIPVSDSEPWHSFARWLITLAA